MWNMYACMCAGGDRGSPPAVLLRESYREHGKVKVRSLANLSRWPELKVEKLSAGSQRPASRGGSRRGVCVGRSLPHGHVAAALGTARRWGSRN